MELLVVGGVFAAVALGVWLVLTLVWWLLRRAGKATGVDTKVDRFLDTDGAQLPPSEALKHNGRPRGGSV